MVPGTCRGKGARHLYVYGKGARHLYACTALARRRAGRDAPDRPILRIGVRDLPRQDRGPQGQLTRKILASAEQRRAQRLVVCRQQLGPGGPRKHLTKCRWYRDQMADQRLDYRLELSRMRGRDDRLVA